MKNKIKILMKMSKFKTLVYNLRLYTIKKKWIDKLFLIVAYNGSKIKLSKEIKVNIIGRLFIGNPFTNKFYESCKYQTLLNMKKKSELNIYGSVSLGPECKIVVEESAKLTINDKTYFSAESKILCCNEIIIGEKCSISWNTLIMDSNGKSINGKEINGKIIIGNNVWIGANSVILKNSNIGNGCVVAANSVVRGIFPDNSLIAGNPAKVIKENISWS